LDSLYVPPMATYAGDDRFLISSDTPKRFHLYLGRCRPALGRPACRRRGQFSGVHAGKNRFIFKERLIRRNISKPKPGIVGGCLAYLDQKWLGGCCGVAQASALDPIPARRHAWASRGPFLL